MTPLDRLVRELDGTDAYAVLGVARTAPRSDIRRAYRARVRAHHPDLPSSRDATSLQTMQMITVAHEILDKWRDQYDARLPRPPASRAASSTRADTGRYRDADPATGSRRPGAYGAGTHQTGAHPTTARPTTARPTSAYRPGAHQTGTYRTGSDTYRAGTHQTRIHPTRTTDTRPHGAAGAGDTWMQRPSSRFDTGGHYYSSGHHYSTGYPSRGATGHVNRSYPRPPRARTRVPSHRAAAHPRHRRGAPAHSARRWRSGTRQIPKVHSHLGLAIAATFLCAPVGVVGLVYSLRVPDQLLSGDLAAARRASHRSLVWCLAGGALGLVLLGIMTVLSERHAGR